MKAREFDKVVAKLGMQTRDTDHRHAWLVHDGVTVARTKRSHGQGKSVPEFAVRRQLHVNEEQFTGLYSCTFSKEEYIKVLKSKGVIETKPDEKKTDPPKPTT